MIIPHDIASYEELVDQFHWDIPERLNIAEEICERHARETPDAPAIIEDSAAGGRQSVTFSELKVLSDRLAAGLRAMGIGRGDRVACTLSQGTETMATHLACFKLGAISVPIASVYGSEGLAFRIDDCTARLLVTDAEGAEKLRGGDIRPTSLDRIVVAGENANKGDLTFAEVVETGGPEPGTADTAADEPAMIFYTSGTTGAAKGAVHAHRTVRAHVPGFQLVFDLAPRPGDIFWTPSVWSWLGSLGEVVFPALFFGHPVVAASGRFSVERAYEVLEANRITCPFLAPSVLRRMRASPPGPEHRFGLRAIMTGGEAISSELLEWTRETLGAPVNDVFGLTECNLIACGCAALFATPVGAIGRPEPGRRIAVLDGNGNRLPTGEVGEICNAAEGDPIVTLGYWNNPGKTAERITDGWMRTGDGGSLDDDGFLHFHGRLDDLILTGGLRVGPEEVEGQLLAHDAVMEAAVIGVPDVNLGQAVAAFVRLKEGIEPADDLRDELRDFVKTRLARHACPRHLKFVDDYPTTPSGKIIRSQLRERHRRGIGG